MPTILVIDDEADEFRHSLDVALEEYTRLYASNAADGLSLMESETDIACVLLDNVMPASLAKVDEEEGLAALTEIRKRHPAMPVIMLTAVSDPGMINRAKRLGAYHYLLKPPDVDVMRVMVRAAMEERTYKEQIANLRTALRLRDEAESAMGDPVSFGRLVGVSPALRRVSGLINRVAKENLPVLILGESGTGKELVAQEVQERSGRKDRPFVTVNCAALPDTLLESELFGHLKGSFSGADRDRDGAFRAASGGTLFLDEIAEMPVDLQAKLLRVLQEQLVKPVGADVEERIDVRVLAATKQDIDTQMEEGRFREDLFYRLNVIRILLPPLRERPEDVPILADLFLRESDPDADRFFRQDAIHALQDHPWPGNVRQLQSVVRRTRVFAESSELKPEDIRWDEELKPGGENYDALWQAVLAGRAPVDHALFEELFGLFAAAGMVERAERQANTDREAGRLLRFIPEDDPGDKAFNAYRAWKRRLLKRRQEREEHRP